MLFRSLLFIVFLSDFDFAKSLKHQKLLPSFFSVAVFSPFELAYKVVPPIRLIALIRQRTGVRSQTKERAVRQGAIRKPRT